MMFGMLSSYDKRSQSLS
jgi:hypothetical protein